LSNLKNDPSIKTLYDIIDSFRDYERLTIGITDHSSFYDTELFEKYKSRKSDLWNKFLTHSFTTDLSIFGYRFLIRSYYYTFIISIICFQSMYYIFN
jgi:hypothetical protein